MWLNFVLLGILVTNSVCWAKLERFGAKQYSAKAISWMFRRTKVLWSYLLTASVLAVIERYEIKDGHLVADDTDIRRAKTTSAIAKAHKIYDKKTSGYFNGQSLVFLLLVSNELTLPVGFDFYEPDPVMVAYYKEDERLRKNGVKKKYRPKEPQPSVDYPSKAQITLNLMQDFVDNCPEIKIKSSSVDALYCTKEFIEQAAKITKQEQVITQIKCKQIIIVNNKPIAVNEFFKQYHGKTETVRVRSSDKTITYVGAKFKVRSHDKKYYIIALKYNNEDEYRYIVANDMTWTPVSIIQAYALRWLVEVFFQDWKSYEGWNQMAKQPDIDGSVRGLILSLLCDHALLLHPEQTSLSDNHEFAATVGSLREKVVIDSLLVFIESIINNDNPQQVFDEYAAIISQAFELKRSIKHMRHPNMKIDITQN
jgi:hypothetical protein